MFVDGEAKLVVNSEAAVSMATPLTAPLSTTAASGFGGDASAVAAVAVVATTTCEGERGAVLFDSTPGTLEEEEQAVVARETVVDPPPPPPINLGDVPLLAELPEDSGLDL